MFQVWFNLSLNQFPAIDFALEKIMCLYHLLHFLFTDTQHRETSKPVILY